MQVDTRASDGALVRLSGGLILAVDEHGTGDVYVHGAATPLDRGTESDRRIADAVRKAVAAAEFLDGLLQQCPSSAVMLDEHGNSVRTDHGMLYID
jgi:hypothetical protein